MYLYLKFMVVIKAICFLFSLMFCICFIYTTQCWSIQGCGNCRISHHQWLADWVVPAIQKPILHESTRSLIYCPRCTYTIQLCFVSKSSTANSMSTLCTGYNIEIHFIHWTQYEMNSFIIILCVVYSLV